MKKLFCLLLALSILLTGCGYTGICLNDVDIDFTDSNSIIMAQMEYSKSQIIKAYNEEDKALLMVVPYGDEITGDFMATKIIELPEGVTNFKIIGYSNNQEHGNVIDIIVDTNIGYYAICEKVSPYNNAFRYFKIENDEIIYSNIKNVIYKDESFRSAKIYCNNSLKYASIINKEDNIYFIKDEEEVLLFENNEIKDSFFLISYGTRLLDYYNFIIINQNNEIKYCSVSPDNQLVINKDIVVVGEIINFGPIINRMSKIHGITNNPFEKQLIDVADSEGNIVGEKEVMDYYYILTDENVYVYDKVGTLFYTEVVEGAVYGINFINFGYINDGIELQLAYKTDDNLFRWETKTIGKVEN